MSYVFGALLPYYLVPWVCIPFSVVFLLGFWHVPETPLYLLNTGEFEVMLCNCFLLYNLESAK